MQPRGVLDLASPRAIERASIARAGSSEVLKDLFAGPLGTLHLGRAYWGAETGRIVVLRQLDVASADLAAAVERAVRVTHPRVVKVLGLVEAGGTFHIASEYVAGVSLWELQRCAMQLDAPVNPRVALRIVRDALLAVADALRVLEERRAEPVPRLLFADAAWIAEFGDTLLTEVGVAGVLAGRRPASDPASAFEASSESQPTPWSYPSREVFAAGVLLWQLLANRALFDTSESGVRASSHDLGIPPLDSARQAPKLPAVVTGLVSRALSSDRRQSFFGPESMVLAIDSLPAEWIATDLEVQDELARLMPDVLEQRRRSSHQLEHADELDRISWDTPTRSVRPKGLARLRSSGRPSSVPVNGGRVVEQANVRPPGARATSLEPPEREHLYERPHVIRVSFAPESGKSRRLLAVVGTVCVAGISLVALAYRALNHDAPVVVKDQASVVEQAVVAPQARALPAGPTPAGATATVPNPVPSTIASTGPRRSRATAAARPAKAQDPSPAPEPSSEPAEPSQSKPKRNSGAFRPRSIDSYRPKGI